MILLACLAVAFAVVATWLLAPLHDPNDESLPMSLRGGVK
jgi:hypothetical protein